MAGESAPVPIHPVIAAQKLRILSRSVHSRAKNLLPFIGAGGNSNAQSAEIYHVGALNNAVTVDQFIARVREAAAARKSALANEHIDELSLWLSRERANNNLAYDVLSSASASDPNVLRDEINKLVQSAQQVVDLVQSLPTSEDMPSGNMENMLRAIMAILRTGGFPGAENLKWEEVKKNGEKTQSNGGTAPTEGAAELSVPF